jgi:hypothetical protein
VTSDRVRQPALTVRDRQMLERELADVERRLPELRARGEHLVSRPEADVTELELDDAVDDVGFAENWAIKLRELLELAPTISVPTSGEARLHSRVRVRLDDGRDLWYRIVVSVGGDRPARGCNRRILGVGHCASTCRKACRRSLVDQGAHRGDGHHHPRSAQRRVAIPIQMLDGRSYRVQVARVPHDCSEFGKSRR